MAAEVRDAIRWFNAGMTHREIAVALDRSESAVQQKLAGFRFTAKGTLGLPPDGDSLQMAKRALAFELAVARSERATAPLLRSWPAGLWP
jgi:hypothetical protein